jgi:hypothetical protein
MKKETIREYTILFQYLLLLKEPTYIFLIQIFQHLSPVTWWEDFIEPIFQWENKENFKYLDFSDLLNVFKMNWEKIWSYLDKNYRKYKYNKEYKLVNKVHGIRTIVAHANEIDMSPFVFTGSLACLLEYARLIRAESTIAGNSNLTCIKLKNHCRKQSLSGKTMKRSKHALFLSLKIKSCSALLTMIPFRLILN